MRTKERGFDDELLEHAMKVFAQQAGLEDLQVDWNSSGLGAVKHDICDHNLVLPRVPKSAYGTGEQVVLRGLKTAGMNGQTGTVTTCLRSGRYGVLLSNGGQVAIRPCNLDVLPDSQGIAMADKSNECIRVGDQVLLTGLSDDSLNGVKGIVIRSRTANDRYGVRVHNDRCVAIRGSNLIKLESH